MENYLFEFATPKGRITISKRDDGSYAVSLHNWSDTLVVATCSEFADAVSVFRRHLCEMEDDIVKQETGNV